VEDEVDREAINNFIFNISSDPSHSFSQRYGSKLDPNDEWSGLGRDMFLRYAMGLGAWKLYGSCETVAERIRELHDVGIESILTCFFDPIRGLHQMEDGVLPLLRKMGLRR
jgi:FMNH2-dependent dimethyl sulfone monooxygenase